MDTPILTKNLIDNIIDDNYWFFIGKPCCKFSSSSTGPENLPDICEACKETNEANEKFYAMQREYEN